MECDPGRSDQPELEEVPDGEDGAGQAELPLERHELAGGPRPDQQHHAAALPRAARDPDQRVRHGARRPRRRAERGHPPRQPGAARDRRGPEDPRRRRTGRSRELAATATRRSGRSRASARTCGNFIVKANETAQASAERRGELVADVREAAALPRRAEADDGGPGRALRRDDAGDQRPRRRRARPQPLHPGARPVLAPVGPVARQPRRGGRGRRPRAAGHRAAARGPARLRRGREPGLEEPRPPAHELRRDRRHRAPDGLHLLPDHGDQRLRLAQPLPARRPDRVDLCSFYATSVAFGCESTFGEARGRRRGRRATRAEREDRARTSPTCRGRKSARADRAHARRPDRRGHPAREPGARGSSARPRSSGSARARRTGRRARDGDPEPFLDYLLGNDG